MNDSQKCWQDFLSGDKKALSDIFLQYHDALFRYGMKLSGSESLVKDCIQDLFLKLWKNRAHLKPVENPRPYLFKSIRNHIIDSLSLRKSQISIDGDFEHPFDIEFSPEDFMINIQVTAEIRQQVIGALNKLMPRQREVIFLRYFEEQPFETISLIMDMNVQSVRNILHRAMEAMRSMMPA
jgi:RNA polymerase sigma factor (sigma-70 family)